MTHSHPLESFWTRLLTGSPDAGALVEPGGHWDDPLYDAASGEAVHTTAIPRLAAWFQERSAGGPEGIRHLRTLADERRVAVESVVSIRDGLTWDAATEQGVKRPRIDVGVAVVGDRSAAHPDVYSAVRVYFGTWAVLDGASRMRRGPVAPIEHERTRAVMASMPVVSRYFDALATGDASVAAAFEPDGYFREPANNYTCGADQLARHFQHILTLGGVGIEFLTAIRQGDSLGLELQTVKWGSKQMPVPQAGFAAYDLGPHGLVLGARVYDSVVPPTF